MSDDVCQFSSGQLYPGISLMRIRKPPDSNILYYCCREIAQIQPARARLWFRNSFLWLRFRDCVRERRRAGCYIEPRIGYVMPWMPAPGVRTTMESKFGIAYASAAKDCQFVTSVKRWYGFDFHSDEPPLHCSGAVSSQFKERATNSDQNFATASPVCANY